MWQIGQHDEGRRHHDGTTLATRRSPRLGMTGYEELGEHSKCVGEPVGVRGPRARARALARCCDYEDGVRGKAK